MTPSDSILYKGSRNNYYERDFENMATNISLQVGDANGFEEPLYCAI